MSKIEITGLQAMALFGVLQMDVRHGWRNCFGITATQALRNFGVIGPRQVATKKIKLEILEQLEAEGYGKKDAEKPIVGVLLSDEREQGSPNQEP